jgi:capsular exopolysaccharide synthesis family protein
VLVTSALRGEGKTTTLVNTAVVFAQLGLPVLIIDSDLRRPNCHRLLKMDNSEGLSELLAGQIDVDGAIRPTSVEKLSFISAGALPPNPAELLGSERMHELLQQLRQRFEFIFIDSSPLLAVSDAVFLSTMVEGTLLVVNRNTPKPLVKKARARLSVPQGKIVGMLLNRVDIHNNEYGGYYKQYYTYYGADSSKGSALPGNGNGASSHNGAAAAANGNGKHSHKSARKKSSQVSDGVATKKSIEEHSTGTDTNTESVAPPVAGAQSSESPREAKPEKADEQKPTETPKLRGHTDGRASERLLANSNATPNEVPSESPPTLKFSKLLAAKLKEAIGPMAPVVITDRTRALGQPAESFPSAKLEEVMKRLSKELPDDSHRVRFEEAMSIETKKTAGRDTPRLDRREAAAAGVSSEANDMQSSAAAEESSGAVANPGMKSTSRNGLPAGFLDRVRTKLREAMGPMAPLVLSDQIRALGESFDSFPEAKLDELTKRVSEEIFDEYHRTRFANEIKNLGAQFERT